MNTSRIVHIYAHATDSNGHPATVKDGVPITGATTFHYAMLEMTRKPPMKIFTTGEHTPSFPNEEELKGQYFVWTRLSIESIRKKLDCLLKMDTTTSILVMDMAKCNAPKFIG